MTAFNYDILYFFIETGVKYVAALNFKDFWSEIGRAVMSFNSVSDVLDVILVTFVIYSAIKLIRETKAVQLAKGFILLLIVYALVNLFGMQASNYILSLVFNNLLLVLVIIFTPEIRHALESVGRSSVSKFNFSDSVRVLKKNDVKRCRKWSMPYAAQAPI